MSASDSPLRPTLDQQVTFLYIHDLAVSAHFYHILLGLPLVLDQGICRIYRVGRDAFVGLCQRPDVAVHPESVILTLVSDDVDAWHGYLVAHGVTVEKAPTLNPTYHIYHCFVRDPDGYLIEIQTFLDPAWPRP